jgi:hypothetical protein
LNYTVEQYKGFVNDYKNVKTKEAKSQLKDVLAKIKSGFQTSFTSSKKEYVALKKKEFEYYHLFEGPQLFGERQSKKYKMKKIKLEAEINGLKTVLDEINNNAIYNNAFEWRFEFPEVLDNSGDFIGFDVIIGNPPYILSRETFSEQTKNYFKSNYKFIHEKPNLFILFIERCNSLMNANGKFGFIIPNSWTGIESATLVRQFLLKHTTLLRIINLLGETFEDASVEGSILLYQKNITVENVRYASLSKNDIREEEFIKYDQQKWLLNRNYLIDITSQDDEHELILKIKNKSILLQERYNAKVGLQAYEKGKGTPKQSEEDVKNHIFDFTFKFDQETYPYLNGLDVARYKIHWSGTWMRYGKWLSQPKELAQFNCARILVREITGQFPCMLKCCYTEDCYLNNKSIINILALSNNYSLKFLLGYLNSALASFYHKRQTVKGNRELFPKIVVKDLKNFPIPNISEQQQLPIISLVDKILTDKKANPEADTKELEEKINELVFDLYGVTDEERKIVMGG